MYAPGDDGSGDPGHQLGIYGLENSPRLISTITDEMIGEAAQWQARAFEALYPTTTQLGRYILKK